MQTFVHITQSLVTLLICLLGWFTLFYFVVQEIISFSIFWFVPNVLSSSVEIMIMLIVDPGSLLSLPSSLTILSFIHKFPSTIMEFLKCMLHIITCFHSISSFLYCLRCELRFCHFPFNFLKIIPCSPTFLKKSHFLSFSVHMLPLGCLQIREQECQVLRHLI